MKKQHKKISTKEDLNLTSNSKGITLVALIITIIVMLILVAVSVTIAIKGNLFGITKRAAKETEREKNVEQDLSGERIKINGIWYDSFEDYVGGNPSEDQKESSIKFSYEPKGWTSGPVKVKIESEGALQYSRDGVTWENYTEEIEVTNNGTIYAKEAGSSKEEKILIENIDTEAPKISTELASPRQAMTSINLEMAVADTVSGISKIEWYYRKDGTTNYEKLTDEYAKINGTEVGIKTEVKATKELSKLEKDTTYNIYVVVYDVAGNERRIPETNTIDIKTMASLLGKSATIDGQKYIVIYEPEEKIKIDGTEYEIKDAQLISADVLEPNKVYLGFDDGQADWENSDVKSEADLDDSNTLDDVEKAIYLYNHMIELLNKKCESLVDISNPDIVGVRSVGSNPIDPSSENGALYTSDFLENNPTDMPGRYNGVGKSADENYLTDWERMQKLAINKSENSTLYWLASRTIDEATASVRMLAFGCRRVNSVGALSYYDVFDIETIGTEIGSRPYGVRPVISVKADAISKYLN